MGEMLRILGIIFLILLGQLGSDQEGLKSCQDAANQVECVLYGGKTGQVFKLLPPAKEQGEKVPENAVIGDFPEIYQEPELPTGCEITAMAMALHYYGFGVDKMDLALNYLPKLPLEFYYGEDGTLYGNDMKNYFLGDPTTQEGFICGTGAIVTAANGYLAEVKSPLKAEDISGAAPEELYGLVSQGTPVVVWITIEMVERVPEMGWFTESGDYIDFSSNDHAGVLIGYDTSTVTIADPITGRVTYDRGIFEGVFASRGNQCVILKY